MRTAEADLNFKFSDPVNVLRAEFMEAVSECSDDPDSPDFRPLLKYRNVAV